MNFEARRDCEHQTCNSYKKWAQKHRTFILLADELLGRMLYWVPIGTNDESSRFREIAWGLLQLHRLLFDVFTAENPPQESYGTSVSVEPSIPANEIRLVLSILQNLWPVAYELAQNTSQKEDSAQRQASIRVWIERCRFVLRIILLGSYWARMSATGCIHPGVLLNGGNFHNINGYSTEQERKCVDRDAYTGRRSGRRLVPSSLQNQASHRNLYLLPMGWKNIILQLCEFVYISRPLLSAEAGNSKIGSKWNVFFATFLLDLASVELLGRSTSVGNILTQNELKRRKFRILLYLLRQPCWGSITQPLSERLTSTLESFPVGGKLLRNYLWEYLLYAKLYLVEE